MIKIFHPRAVLRLVWLTFEIILALVRFVPMVSFSKKPSRLCRAQWLHLSCRRVLRIFGTELRVSGPAPEPGLMIANHLSYLDILVLSAVAPAIFVAKRDVRSWPIFGWLSCLGGTLFTDRQRRTQVGPLNDAIRDALAQGATVVLFPEGTSSGGQTVLPFKSALLEPAVQLRAAITVASLAYDLSDGDVSEELCYWKDMTFLPHLINLLTKKRVRAVVRLERFSDPVTDRKTLAPELRAKVVRMRDFPRWDSPGFASADNLSRKNSSFGQSRAIIESGYVRTFSDPAG